MTPIWDAFIPWLPKSATSSSISVGFKSETINSFFFFTVFFGTSSTLGAVSAVSTTASSSTRAFLTIFSPMRYLLECAFLAYRTKKANIKKRLHKPGANCLKGLLRLYGEKKRQNKISLCRLRISGPFFDFRDSFNHFVSGRISFHIVFHNPIPSL